MLGTCVRVCLRTHIFYSFCIWIWAFSEDISLRRCLSFPRLIPCVCTSIENICLIEARRHILDLVLWNNIENMTHLSNTSTLTHTHTHTRMHTIKGKKFIESFTAWVNRWAWIWAWSRTLALFSSLCTKRAHDVVIDIYMRIRPRLHLSFSCFSLRAWWCLCFSLSFSYALNLCVHVLYSHGCVSDNIDLNRIVSVSRSPYRI